MSYFYQCQYNDGTKFPETMEKAREYPRPYSEIDKDKLEKFNVYDEQSGDLVLQLHLDDPDKRLIFVRRVLERIGRTVIWLVGWQKKVNGENVQSIQLLFPDGHIESIGSWKQAPYNKPEQAK